MIIESDMGGCQTYSKHRIVKIDLYFDDTILNKRFKLSLFPWMRVDQLKRELAVHHFKDRTSWRDLRLFCKNVQLVNEKKGFFDYYAIEPESTIIIKKNTHEEDLQNGVINPYQIFQRTPEEIENLLMNVQSGLSCGRKPKLASEGMSGTYFLENQHKKVVAVYKPFDQQPYAPNNPRSIVGELGCQGIRKGILSGECATRQVAAYLLDSTHFHCVPPTTYVQIYHPSFSYRSHCENHPILSMKECNLKKVKTKHGSLQEFVQYSDVVGNLGSHQFDVDEVHKVAILDLRTLNCDRNEANILVQKMSIIKNEQPKKFLKFIPIDHGLSFPDNFEIYDYQIVWMNYNQTNKPLSEKSLQFIRDIDPIKDCQLLRQKLGFREICLRNFRIAQIFLKKMAAAKFTLAQIGKMVYRNDDESDTEEENESIPRKEEYSQLQKLVKQAQAIFFTVKENGIKSTVEFQIGLIKLRKQEQSLQQLCEIKQILSDEFQQELGELKHKNSNQYKVNKETSIDKTQKLPKEKSSQSRSRNISLPNLKKKSSSVRKRKQRIRRRKDGKHTKQNGYSKQNWGQIFFHYFQDLLQRFINQRIKLRKKPEVNGRHRLMSEIIEA